METSIQVMVLVSVVAMATLFAFYLDVRRQAEYRRFVEWLKSDREADWRNLTRSDRFLSIRAVEILRRGALAGDAEFQARYRRTRHDRRFATAMIVALTGIGLLVAGTTLFDWTW